MVALIAAIIELVILILKASLDAASEAKKAQKEYLFKREQFETLVQTAISQMAANAPIDKKASDNIDDQMDHKNGPNKPN